MSLSFLPVEIQNAIKHLNYNFLTEIRLRYGQPVIIQYKGEYRYLNSFGSSARPDNAIITEDIAPIINNAMGGCVYNFTEQMKNGFITVEHGVRIGLAGEYVTQGNFVNAIKSLTSINIRIPHEVKGCADYLCNALFSEEIFNTLIFSKPGMGKTTILRDTARILSKQTLRNVLIFDERNEISAMDGFGVGFDLGYVDVVRCYNKLGAITSAIRAMRPDVIITDELYGESDFKAVQYAIDCGIAVIASSHICDREELKKLPFDFFARIKKIGVQPEIYDKNFNLIGNCCCDDDDRGVSCVGQEET